MLEQPPVPEYDELVNALKESAESYLLGEISYEDAVEKIEARRREIYQK